MRKMAFALLLTVVIAGGSDALRADNAAEVTAINASSNALDDAFERQDAGKIRSLMTPDHLAVTSYYSKPMDFDEVMATLGDLRMDQTITSKVVVTLLGRDAAIRTFIVDMKGTYKDKPLAPRMFITETLVKRDGKWLERQYQATPLPK